MNNLLRYKTEWTDLELVEQINIFRNLEGNRSPLRHDTLRGIIKDEFEEEILSQNILEKSIPSNGGRPFKVFILTNSQAKQVLLRESKFVRRAVIKKIEEIEKLIQDSQINSIKFQPKELVSYLIEMRKTLKVAGISNEDVAKVFIAISEQQGVRLPEFFVKDKITDDMNINKICEYGRTAKNPTYENYVVNLSFPIKRSINVRGK